MNDYKSNAELLVKEAERATELFPEHPFCLFESYAIFAEEAGELAKAINDHTWKGKSLEDIETEAIQTGAMVLRFLENLKRHY